MSKRFQAEFNEAHATPKSTVQLKASPSYVVDAIVQCYKEDHTFKTRLFAKGNGYTKVN